ncbi:MAG: type II secretion system protein [Planctomycetes bacterium]|nr:type II secretion system protein [Planctomycetota bacterium]
MRANARGFTLVELLIVIGIISLLAVALLPQVREIFMESKGAQTTARIQLLQQMIEKYQRDNGDYPVSDYALLPKSIKAKADSRNAGIECLLIQLGQKRLGGTLTFDDHPEWLKNTDEDDNTDEIPELRTRKKLEVVDAWGNPFAYFHNASYGKKQTIALGVSQEDAEAEAMKDDRGYLNPRKYQIISAGANGTFGDDDDVCYPERPKH